MFCRFPAHFLQDFISVDGGVSVIGFQNRKMFRKALSEDNPAMQKYQKRKLILGRSFGLENQTFSACKPPNRAHFSGSQCFFVIFLQKSEDQTVYQ